MDSGLKNSHVFITGASGGIGIAMCKLYLQEGAKITAHYNNNPIELTDLKSEFPESVCLVQADVLDEKMLISAVEQSVNELGTIEHMIVNHGIWLETPVSIADMTLDQWNRTIGTDLTGAFLFTREYLKQLKNHTDEIHAPSIVYIGSTAGIFGEENHADYASAKSALMYGLTKSAKNEIVRIHPMGRVNSVAPGWVRTPMAEGALKDKKVVAKVLATMALRKIATPEDIANATIFLTSKLSGHTSGDIIEVTGGMEGRTLHS